MSAYNGSVLEADLECGDGVVPVGHRYAGECAVVVFPKGSDIFFKALTAFGESSCPDEPVGLCICFSVVKRHTVVVDVSLVGGEFRSDNALVHDACIHELVPNDVVLHGPCAFSVECETIAAVAV